MKMQVCGEREVGERGGCRSGKKQRVLRRPDEHNDQTLWIVLKNYIAELQCMCADHTSHAT